MLKDFEWHDWVIVAVLALWAALAIPYVIFGWPAIYAFAKHPAVTSWVQAIGSIGAILAAVFIARHQYVDARDKEAQRIAAERAAYAREAYLVLREARRTLDYIAKKLRDSVGKRCRMRTERIISLELTLQTLSAKSLPPAILPYVLTAQREMSYTLMAVRGINEAPVVTEARVKNANDRARVVRRQAAQCREWRDGYMWHAGQIPDDSYSSMCLDEMIED